MAIQFKKGQWVTDDWQIGIIKDVYNWDDEILLDIILYTPKGDKIGRQSPAQGGPKGFEPCCASEGWKIIHKPRFPLKYLSRITDALVYV